MQAILHVVSLPTEGSLLSIFRYTTQSCKRKFQFTTCADQGLRGLTATKQRRYADTHMDQWSIDRFSNVLTKVAIQSRSKKTILMALAEIGIVDKPQEVTFDDLVELRLGALFMPHGLGHFIGNFGAFSY